MGLLAVSLSQLFPWLVGVCAHIYAFTEDSLLDTLHMIEIPIRHDEQGIEECII